MASEAYSNNDISALRSAILKIKHLKPDALFVPDVSPLMLGLKRELRNADLADLAVYSIYAAKSPDVVEANGDAIEGLSITYPDIGDEDALTHFPKLGAKIISEAANACGSEIPCIKTFLKEHYDFDNFGVLHQNFVIKTFTNGQFRNRE